MASQIGRLIEVEYPNVDCNGASVVRDVFGAPMEMKGKGKGKGLGGGTIEPRECLRPSMNSPKPPYFGADSEVKKKGTKLSDVTGEDTAEEAAAEEEPSEEEPSEEEILSLLWNDCEESDRIDREIDRIDREVMNYSVFAREFFPSRADKQPSPPPCMAMEDKLDLDLDLDFPTSIPMLHPFLLDLI